MHYLDSLIDDIEPRMHAILDNPSDADASIQTSLVAYCWILLDSWIAWRTYRYLLRDTIINTDIDDKWFKTPSSYTCSQIKAIWEFSDLELRFFELETGSKLKTVIDTIQDRRNSAAHYKRNLEGKIRGIDILSISKYLDCFSCLFRFEETKKFIEKIRNQLCNKGEVKLSTISFSNTEDFLFQDMNLHFYDYVSCNSITLRLNNNTSLLFDTETESAFFF